MVNVTTNFRSFKVVVEERRKERVDAIVKRRLIPLHRQAVVGIAFDNLRSDFGLATHCVNGHQRPADGDHF